MLSSARLQRVQKYGRESVAKGQHAVLAHNWYTYAFFLPGDTRPYSRKASKGGLELYALCKWVCTPGPHA